MKELEVRKAEGDSNMKLSLVIPCFNESEVIDQLIDSLFKVLLQQDYAYELILVNDGSRDNTLSKIKSHAGSNANIHYISFSRNFGKEAAILAGLNYSSGDCVLIMDADLQHPPELIPAMVEKYMEGYDQVIARRDREGDPFMKTVTAHMYYKIVNKLVDIEMEDGVGDFRLLSRNALNALLSMKECNRFSKGLFSWIGFKHYQITYKNQSRAAGDTKWSFKQLLQYGLDGMLSFNNKPLRLCIGFGLLLILLSMLYIIYIFVGVILTGIAVPGYFTTLSAIMILGAVQIISVGVIGEYVGRIYYEVKKRPHYIVEESDINCMTKRDL